MTPKRPDPPRGLGPAGRRAWRAALASLGADLTFTPKELEGLRLVAGQADLVDRLERELAGQSIMVQGHAGQPRANPLITTLTTARTAQAKLLSEVRLEVDSSEGLPVRSRRAQRAAQARWRARRELGEQRRELSGG